jgi:serine protease AprX
MVRQNGLMRHIRSHFPLGSALILLCAILQAVHGAPAGSASSKISPLVLQQLEGRESAEFLVILSEQADLSGAELYPSKEARGRFVFETLFKKAESSQRQILQHLDENGITYRSFYVANAIMVKGGLSTAMDFAARPEVARIESNQPSLQQLPMPNLETLGNRFAPDFVEPNISQVRAPETWAAGYRGQGVVIGGADTGYQWDHPALKPQYRGWNGLTANHDYNWHDSVHSGGGACGPDSPVPCDDYGHGTHTMGTAVGDDGDIHQIGVAPGAKWIGCRNMSVGYGTPARYLECMEFFLAPYPVGGSPAQGDPAKAPDVTLNSWECIASEGCSAGTLLNGIRAQRAAGILTIVSAGNSGPACSSVSSPLPIYFEAFAVGSLQTGTDLIASSSSRGPVTADGSGRRKPDISAPGTSIRSSYPTGAYSLMSGTSMAAPHVAGAVALVLSARADLKGQVGMIEGLLGDSAGPLLSTACGSVDRPNNTFGFGRLDAKSAVDRALSGDANLPGISVVPESLDFGRIIPGASADLSFTVQNMGGGTLMGTVSVPAPFSILSGASYSLGAKQSQTVTIRYSPVLSGSFSANVEFRGSGSLLRSVRGTDAAPTIAVMNSMAADLLPEGVRIRWQSGMESQNLGFNLYRESGSRFEKLNSSLIAGTALMASGNIEFLTGHHYSWWDAQGRDGSQYWIEDVDIFGSSRFHGPVESGDGRSAPDTGAIVESSPAIFSGTTLQGRLRPVSAPESSSGTESDFPLRLARHAAILSGNSLKILVKSEGLYRISYAELQSAGLDPEAVPEKLHLYSEGREIPLTVRSARGDRLAPGDWIEFFGTAPDMAYSGDRAYWLASGPSAPLRIGTIGVSGRDLRSRSFPFALQYSEKKIYASAVRNGAADNFYAAVLGGAPVELEVNLPSFQPADAGEIVIETDIEGLTRSDHRLALSLDGRFLGEFGFSNQSRHFGRFAVPAASVAGGFFRLALSSDKPGNDFSLLRSIRVTYPRSLSAEEDFLKFTLAGGQKAEVTGFQSPGIRLLDITDPDRPLAISSPVVSAPGGYILHAAAAGRGDRTLVAFGEGRIRRAASIEFHPPLLPFAGEREADMLIIAYPGFIASLEPLRALRESQGLRTRVVDVQDLYDTFNFGRKSPQAIKDFLRQCRQSWVKPPRYVLLVGDASYDPRDYLGKGSRDFIPAPLVDDAYMETVSDRWFVAFDEAGKPPLSIGRLPARSAGEASAMVEKILRYEASAPSSAALLVSDISDTYDFRSSSSRLREILSPGLSVRHIERGAGETSELQKELLEAMGRGTDLVHYSGHGAVSGWRGNFFTSADARSLQNAAHLPLFLSSTCLNGYFLNPDDECLGEALLRGGEGGAPAAWMSAGISEPAAQIEMNTRLARLFMENRNWRSLTLGEAIESACADSSLAEIAKTYILLGDPAMRLR